MLDAIPPIGETYLIRQLVNSVYEAFFSFSYGNNLSIEEFMTQTSSSGAEGAALNKLRELRSIGLVNYKKGKYTIKVDPKDINKEYFIDYVHDKLEKHSFTIELQKIQAREIGLDDLTTIIDNKIQSTNFAKKTLETYAQTFLGWLDFSEIKITNLSAAMMRRAKNALSYTPQMYPSDVDGFIVLINDGYELCKSKREQKLLYDSKSMGLIRYSSEEIMFSKILEGVNIDNSIERKYAIAIGAKKMEKVQVAYEILLENPSIKSRNFKSHIGNILDGLNSQVYKNKTSRALYLWAEYIIEAETEYNKLIHADPKGSV